MEKLFKGELFTRINGQYQKLSNLLKSLTDEQINKLKSEWVNNIHDGNSDFINTLKDLNYFNDEFDSDMIKIYMYIDELEIDEDEYEYYKDDVYYNIVTDKYECEVRDDDLNEHVIEFVNNNIDGILNFEIK